MRRTLVVVTLAVFSLAWGWLWWSQQQLDRATVTVGEATVAVEVASSIPTLRKGLSGRASLPDGTGMLFRFPKEERHAIWMRDMRFAIDILWIRDGVVVDVAPEVPPPSGAALENPALLRIYEPRLPADMVLEVPAGFAAAHGVKIGDAVEVRR